MEQRLAVSRTMSRSHRDGKMTRNGRSKGIQKLKKKEVKKTQKNAAMITGQLALSAVIKGNEDV